MSQSNNNNQDQPYTQEEEQQVLKELLQQEKQISSVINDNQLESQFRQKYPQFQKYQSVIYGNNNQYTQVFDMINRKNIYYKQFQDLKSYKNDYDNIMDVKNNFQDKSMLNKITAIPSIYDANKKQMGTENCMGSLHELIQMCQKYKVMFFEKESELIFIITKFHQIAMQLSVQNMYCSDFKTLNFVIVEDSELLFSFKLFDFSSLSTDFQNLNYISNSYYPNPKKFNAIQSAENRLLAEMYCIGRSIQEICLSSIWSKQEEFYVYNRRFKDYKTFLQYYFVDQSSKKIQECIDLLKIYYSENITSLIQNMLSLKVDINQINQQIQQLYEIQAANFSDIFSEMIVGIVDIKMNNIYKEMESYTTEKAYQISDKEMKIYQDFSLEARAFQRISQIKKKSGDQEKWNSVWKNSPTISMWETILNKQLGQPQTDILSQELQNLNPIKKEKEKKTYIDANFYGILQASPYLKEEFYQEVCTLKGQNFTCLNYESAIEVCKFLGFHNRKKEEYYMILQDQIQVLKDKKEKDIKFFEKQLKRLETMLKSKKPPEPELMFKIKQSIIKITYDGLLNIDSNAKNQKQLQTIQQRAQELILEIYPNQYNIVTVKFNNLVANQYFQQQQYDQVLKQNFQTMQIVKQMNFGVPDILYGEIILQTMIAFGKKQDFENNEVWGHKCMASNKTPSLLANPEFDDEHFYIENFISIQTDLISDFHPKYPNLQKMENMCQHVLQHYKNYQQNQQQSQEEPAIVKRLEYELQTFHLLLKGKLNNTMLNDNGHESILDEFFTQIQKLSNEDLSNLAKKYYEFDEDGEKEYVNQVRGVYSLDFKINVVSAFFEKNKDFATAHQYLDLIQETVPKNLENESPFYDLNLYRILLYKIENNKIIKHNIDVVINNTPPKILSKIQQQSLHLALKQGKPEKSDDQPQDEWEKLQLYAKTKYQKPLNKNGNQQNGNGNNIDDYNSDEDDEEAQRLKKMQEEEKIRQQQAQQQQNNQNQSKKFRSKIKGTIQYQKVVLPKIKQELSNIRERMHQKEEQEISQQQGAYNDVINNAKFNNNMNNQNGIFENKSRLYASQPDIQEMQGNGQNYQKVQNVYENKQFYSNYQSPRKQRFVKQQPFSVGVKRDVGIPNHSMSPKKIVVVNKENSQFYTNKSHLVPREQQLLQVKREPKTIVAFRYQYKVIQEELENLEKDSLVNDNLFNFFVAYINEKSKFLPEQLQQEQQNSTMILTPQFYKILSKNNLETKYNNIDIVKASHYIAQSQFYYGKMQELSDFESVLIPIQIKNNISILIEINFEQNLYTLYDCTSSFTNKPVNHIWKNDILTNLFQFFNYMVPDKQQSIKDQIFDIFESMPVINPIAQDSKRYMCNLINAYIIYQKSLKLRLDFKFIKNFKKQLIVLFETIGIATSNKKYQKLDEIYYQFPI